jgi:hypothetical protein
MDAVVLEVEGQKRRSGWVQVVHRDGLLGYARTM